MNRRNEATRKIGGWVERKRRFQRMLSNVMNAAAPKIPALAVATAPASPVARRNPGAR